jgi:hypothetical protein
MKEKGLNRRDSFKKRINRMNTKTIKKSNLEETQAPKPLDL